MMKEELQVPHYNHHIHWYHSCVNNSVKWKHWVSHCLILQHHCPVHRC